MDAREKEQAVTSATLALYRYLVRFPALTGHVVSTIEMAVDLQDAARTAAELAFLKAAVRTVVADVRGERGVFVAFGDRDNFPKSKAEKRKAAEEVRFSVHREEIQ